MTEQTASAPTSFVTEAPAPTQSSTSGQTSQISSQTKSEPVAEGAKASSPAERAYGDKAAPTEGKPEGEETSTETSESEAAAEPVLLTPDDLKIELPENISLDEGALTDFLGFANESKLSKEQGQALLQMHVKQLEAVAKSHQDSAQAAWEATNKKWVAAIKADPDIGGAKSAGVQQTLAKAFEQFGSPEARAAFDLTGAGNSLPIVKMFNKMAQALVGEGKAIPASVSSKGPPSTPAERWANHGKS